MQSEEWRFTAKDIAEKPDLFVSGHRACAGCAPATVMRLILKAVRGPTIVTMATGCMEVVSTIYPYTSWAVPWLHTAFENAAANASGIEAAIKVLRRKGRIKDQHVDVIAVAGDGGTYDIGIQALSGAVERGHDFLFVLYDNEAYMNTGIQRSGGTPLGAATTTSPAGEVIPGKLEHKKPIADIMVAHEIPYVATASPYYWRDLLVKVRKGLEVEGPAFLHEIHRTFPPRGGNMRIPTLGMRKRRVPAFGTQQSHSSDTSKEKASKGVLGSSRPLQTPIHTEI
jgi:pyruvate ferredoxin oxidoreductase beta subunit